MGMTDMGLTDEITARRDFLKGAAAFTVMPPLTVQMIGCVLSLISGAPESLNTLLRDGHISSKLAEPV